MNKEILECYLESTRVANKLSLVVKYVAELYDQQKRLTEKINALRNNKEEKNERGTRHSTLLKLL